MNTSSQFECVTDSLIKHFAKSFWAILYCYGLWVSHVLLSNFANNAFIWNIITKYHELNLKSHFIRKFLQPTSILFLLVSLVNSTEKNGYFFSPGFLQRFFISPKQLNASIKVVFLTVEKSCNCRCFWW